MRRRPIDVKKKLPLMRSREELAIDEETAVQNGEVRPHRPRRAAQFKNNQTRCAQRCARRAHRGGGMPRARSDGSLASAIGRHGPADQTVQVTRGLKESTRAAAACAPPATSALTPPLLYCTLNLQEEDTINTAELQTKLRDIPVPVSLEQEWIKRDMVYVQTHQYLKTPPPPQHDTERVWCFFFNLI